MPGIKILNVVGARPQFVKMSVVSRALKAHAGIDEIIVHTGQHSDQLMSQVFFDEMQIPAPDYHLGIRGTGTSDVVDEMRSALADLFDRESPDWIVAYGDTYSTRAAAEAAHNLDAPLAHVEAGLRSFNEEMPEEINRIIADQFSRVLFAPTEQAVRQLEFEGLNREGRQIMQVGDVMLDAVNFYSKQQSVVRNPEIDLQEGYLLCTLHRAESTDNQETLTELVDGLNKLSEKYQLVLPLHPRTEKRMKSFGLRFAFPTHPPQGYLSMLHLLRHCNLVITDSGGLQKEAFYCQKFCVTMRNETEWTELVDAGYNQLAGTDSESLVTSVEEMLDKTGKFEETFYGDGTAGEQIAAYLADPSNRG